MTREERRVKKIEAHLKRHPNDYQSVIACLKIRSAGYAYLERKKETEWNKRIHTQVKA